MPSGHWQTGRWLDRKQSAPLPQSQGFMQILLMQALSFSHSSSRTQPIKKLKWDSLEYSTSAKLSHYFLNVLLSKMHHESDFCGQYEKQNHSEQTNLGRLIFMLENLIT